MPLAILPGQLTLFIGDSITDCGRRGEHAPLGQGYARLAAELLGARYPDEGRRFLNRGVSGNTVRNLRERWTDDCLRHRPDWVSVLVGINDLNAWLCGQSHAVSPEEFATLYDQILVETRRHTDAQLILLTPFYVSALPAMAGTEDHYRARVAGALPRYLTVVAEMAARHGARLVRTHEIFQRQLQHRDAEDFAPEPVHPNLAGHVLLAHAWLEAVGW